MTENRIVLFYYSKTEHTKMVSEYIKEKINKKQIDVDLIRIYPQKKPGFFKAISSARNQEELPIKNDDIDLTRYQILIIAMPSWAYHPAPFYKTVLKKVNDLSSKKIAIVLSAGVSIKRNLITMQRFKDELESIGGTIIADLIIIVRKGIIVDGKQDIDGFINELSSV